VLLDDQDRFAVESDMIAEGLLLDKAARTVAQILTSFKRHRRAARQGRGPADTDWAHIERLYLASKN